MKMRSWLRIEKKQTGLIKKAAILCCFLAAGSTSAVAQTGTLYGGKMLLSNGTYNVTLQDTSAFAAAGSYTLTLPAAQSTAATVQWLSVGASSGTMSWSSALGTATGSGIAFSPSAPQQFASSTNYLFDLQSAKPGSLSSALNSPSPGAIISSTVDGTTEDATGLTINVSNTLASATGVTEIGLVLHAKANGTSASTAVQQGLSSFVSGGGTNYAALFTNGSVGISTAAPQELLDVNGNIRITGKNGLRITEGTNGTMGVSTLVGGTLTVNTSKVTAYSRIFLMSENGVAATVGTSYVSARTSGTSFTITSTSATDVSNVAWWIVEPIGFNGSYASSSTLVVPTGVTSIKVSGSGGAGGGGGGGADGGNGGGHTLRGGSGGGGGAGEALTTATSVTVVPGETLTITIGAGGTGGAAGTVAGPTAPTAGGSGSNTTIVGSTSGNIFIANGGGGGGAATNGTNAGAGLAGGGGAGGLVAGSSPSGTVGTAGTIGSAGGSGTVNIVGGAGGSGPTIGNANTGGTGGFGKGGAAGTTGDGGSGTAGTSGYVTITF